MRILAAVTARGGSRRVPGKNIRLLGGRPLIVWSIDVAKGFPEICDILVSTDDPTIAEVARAAGALVPWLRPAHLASDTATAADVCLHALQWYEQERGKVDGLLLLQPTSPFRSRDTVRRGIDSFHSHQRRPVVGVSPVKAHPMWCFQLDGETMRPFIAGDGIRTRSQDLSAAYVVNGAFYLIAPDDLRQRGSFYGNDMVPLVMESPADAIDIDTEWDWKMTEAILTIVGPGHQDGR